MLKYSDKIKKKVAKIAKIKTRISVKDKLIKPCVSLIFEETYRLPKEATLNERIFCILNNIFERPKCIECNTNFTNYKKGFLKGYTRFCGRKCASQN